MKKGLFVTVMLFCLVMVNCNLSMVNAQPFPEPRINIELEWNKTCINDTLKLYAEYDQCDNSYSEMAMICTYHNITEYITCQYGCDTIESKCNPAPFWRWVIIAIVIVIILIVLRLITK